MHTGVAETGTDKSAVIHPVPARSDSENIVQMVGKIKNETGTYPQSRDFEDEIPGYLLNDRIRELLSQVSLKEGRETAVVCENLRRCYEALVRENIVATGELELVSAWIADISAILA